MAEQLEMWPSEEKLLTEDKLELLDNYIKQLAAARANRDEAESKYNIEAANVKVVEDKLMGMLKTAGRDNFNTPGIGTAYISYRQNFTTPKTGEDKVALFSYIKDKYGEETLRSMLSIHSATLSSWAKKEIEAGALVVPGLGQPTSTEVLGFRKETV